MHYYAQQRDNYFSNIGTFLNINLSRKIILTKLLLATNFSLDFNLFFILFFFDLSLNLLIYFNLLLLLHIG